MCDEEFACDSPLDVHLRSAVGAALKECRPGLTSLCDEKFACDSTGCPFEECGVCDAEERRPILNLTTLDLTGRSVGMLSREKRGWPSTNDMPPVRLVMNEFPSFESWEKQHFVWYVCVCGVPYIVSKLLRPYVVLHHKPIVTRALAKQLGVVQM